MRRTILISALALLSVVLVRLPKGHPAEIPCRYFGEIRLGWNIQIPDSVKVKYIEAGSFEHDLDFDWLKKDAKP